jgi:hypothetical protein
MESHSAYARIGLALLASGAVAAPLFFFVAGSIPLTALALSSVLLGAISLLLARSLPRVPPQAAQVLLEAGLENVAALVEELGVEAKAVYLPSALAGGRPRALIPLHANPERPEVTRSLPGRMIVEYGPGPEDLGILVTTPGTAVMPFLEAPPGPSSSELEAALARILVGVLDVATSVQVVQESAVVTVRLGGVRFDQKDLWIYRVLGTPLASVAAAVVAEGAGRPVAVRAEEHAAGRSTIHLEVIR